LGHHQSVIQEQETANKQAGNVNITTLNQRDLALRLQQVSDIKGNRLPTYLIASTSGDTVSMDTRKALLF